MLKNDQIAHYVSKYDQLKLSIVKLREVLKEKEAELKQREEEVKVA